MVPWIRVHGELDEKPVTLRLMKWAGIGEHEAIGVLVLFWSRVAKHCTNGFIRGYPDEVLEKWAKWTRKTKRGVFAAWVRAEHMDPDGRVPEWDEYAGKLEVIRERDKQRKADARRGTSNGHLPPSEGHPPDVHKMSTPTRGGRDETETEGNATEPETSSSARGKRSGRDLLLEHLQPSQREAMTQTLDALAQGYDLGAGYGVPTDAQMDQACREVAAGVPAHEIGPNVVRGYLRTVLKPTTKPAHARSGGKPASFADMAAARRRT